MEDFRQVSARGHHDDPLTIIETHTSHVIQEISR